MLDGSSTDIKRMVNVIQDRADWVTDITPTIYILTDINQYSLSVGFDIQQLLEFLRLPCLPEVCWLNPIPRFLPTQSLLLSEEQWGNRWLFHRVTTAFTSIPMVWIRIFFLRSWCLDGGISSFIVIRVTVTPNWSTIRFEGLKFECFTSHKMWLYSVTLERGSALYTDSECYSLWNMMALATNNRNSSVLKNKTVTKAQSTDALVYAYMTVVRWK